MPSSRWLSVQSWGWYTAGHLQQPVQHVNFSLAYILAEKMASTLSVHAALCYTIAVLQVKACNTLLEQHKWHVAIAAEATEPNQNEKGHLNMKGDGRARTVDKVACHNTCVTKTYMQ